MGNPLILWPARMHTTRDLAARLCALRRAHGVSLDGDVTSTTTTSRGGGPLLRPTRPTGPR
jgi:hypothetical protein